MEPSTLIVLASSQRGCTINATDCMYSKLPAEDEQLIYSKHVEDIIGINLKRKCIWLLLITQIHSIGYCGPLPGGKAVEA